MDFGVCYFNHNSAHCARLVASLHSLRKHYGGPATILDTGHSGGIVERIAADRRLEVEVKQIAFVQRRKNSCYCMKASLWRDSPYDATLFLDSDTIVARPIDTLIEIACDRALPGFGVTRFGDWLTTGNIVRGRIERWASVFYDGIGAADLVRASLDAPHPAINTGVVLMRPSAKGGKTTLEAWERLTHAGCRLPWTDELAAQLLIRDRPHVLLSAKFNASPIYYRGSDPAVIWHGHGGKHMTRADGRGEQGHKIWEPVFREVFAGDVGGIRSWGPAGDSTLAHNIGLFL